MNQHNSETEPSMDLPKPQAEGLPQFTGGENYRGESHNAQALESGVSTSQPPPASSHQISSTAVHATQTQPITIPKGFAMPVVHELPPEAQDADRIEREWVMKAKEIIARSSLDPHVQTKEINRVKADYIRKRYNKEIRLAEDS
jgi:hypothetical protein